MAVKTSKIFVVDLEGTCWDDKSRYFQQKNTEIIEIGIALLDIQNNKILRKDSFLVKPRYFEITEYCTNLTGITKEMLEDKPELSVVIDDIIKTYKDPKIQNFIWGSWGYFDLKLITREFEEKQIQRNIFKPWTHINLSQMFAMNNAIKKKIGLGEALNLKNLEFDGDRHRADSDAYNTARLFLK